MKVVTLKRFRDLSENETREVGDVFELKNSERVSFLVSKGLVKTVESKQDDEVKAPKSKKRKSSQKAGE